MKKLSVFAITIALVVLVSGCINERQVTVSSVDGIVINEFSTDMPRYSNDEVIPIYLELENVGGTTATDVTAEIIGASWDSSLDSTDLGAMSPPDLTIQPPVPGDFEVVSESLLAYTALPEGVEAPVTLRARVTYNYASNGVSRVNVINKEEYRRRVQMGTEIPTSVVSANSNGPIHIEVDSRGVSPAIAEGTTDEFAVRIYLTNVGSGAPITDDTIGLLDGTISLQGMGATFTECYGDTGYSGTSITIEEILRKGESVIIPCSVQVNTPNLLDVFSIHFNTNYRYFVEQQLSFTVVGAPV